MKIRTIARAVGTVATIVIGAGAAAAGTFTVDLTHPIPTFHPMEGDPMKPDTSKPWLDSKPIPTFGQQAVLAIGKFPTNQGHFDLGTIVLSEHHGTHLDTSAHYINNEETLEVGEAARQHLELAHQLDSEDLIGRIVLIDISGPVQSELDKNGGKPSPDKKVTDFSNDSPNVVTAEDIEAVADKLGNGTWLVLNLGWSRFYFQGTDFAKDPYINGFNHPGLTPEGVDKLLRIARSKGIRIGGTVTDNISTETGQTAKGEDEKRTNSLTAHVRLLQHDILMVENAANLDALAAAAKSGDCTLVVGAIKVARGTGAQARVLALCH